MTSILKEENIHREREKGECPGDKEMPRGKTVR